MVHPYQSPYTGFDNNPIIFIDPDGKDVYLTIKGANSWATLESIINEGLEGQYKAALQNTGSEGVYRLVITKTENGSIGALSCEGLAFYSTLHEILFDPSTQTNIDIVYGVERVAVGNFETEEIDVADINQFNPGGDGIDRTKPVGATKQGKLIHELAEQYYKQKYDAQRAPSHSYGIEKENAVNGNTRLEGYGNETQRGSVITQTFLEKNGTKSILTYDSDDATLQVRQPKPRGLPRK